MAFADQRSSDQRQPHHSPSEQRARRRWLAILLFTSAASCGDGVTVSGAGGPCGGNSRSPPICRAGYSCVPASDGGPAFGDVGGICRKNRT